MEMFPRSPPQPDDSPSLAPDQQSVLGEPRPFEPGELLALFQANPEVLSPPVAQGPHHPLALGPDVSTLVERWVRKVSLGGDARRGVAKLDIGAGRFAGAELLVIAEPGRVAVELNIPDSADPNLAERLRSRLERRGYAADVTVR